MATIKDYIKDLIEGTQPDLDILTKIGKELKKYKTKYKDITKDIIDEDGKIKTDFAYSILKFDKEDKDILEEIKKNPEEYNIKLSLAAYGFKNNTFDRIDKLNEYFRVYLEYILPNIELLIEYIDTLNKYRGNELYVTSEGNLTDKTLVEKIIARLHLLTNTIEEHELPDKTKYKKFMNILKGGKSKKTVKKYKISL